MRWQIGWQGLVLAIVLFGAGLFLGLYRSGVDPTHSSAGERLQAPATAAAPWFMCPCIQACTWA
jgi:hypothetical protein